MIVSSSSGSVEKDTMTLCSSPDLLSIAPMDPEDEDRTSMLNVKRTVNATGYKVEKEKEKLEHMH